MANEYCQVISSSECSEAFPFKIHKLQEAELQISTWNLTNAPCKVLVFWFGMEEETKTNKKLSKALQNFVMCQWHDVQHCNKTSIHLAEVSSMAWNVLATAKYGTLKEMEKKAGYHHRPINLVWCPKNPAGGTGLCKLTVKYTCCFNTVGPELFKRWITLFIVWTTGAWFS